MEYVFYVILFLIICPVDIPIIVAISAWLESRRRATSGTSCR
jgi:hypothetical protein